MLGHGTRAHKGHFGTRGTRALEDNLDTGALGGHLGTQTLRQAYTWALKALEPLYLVDSP